MAKIIGIDLGTTNSVVAVLDQGEPVVIPNRYGDKITPSVVSFNGDEVIVGKPAKNRMMIYPEYTVKSVKRKMGTDERFKIEDREYSPEEISAYILRALKRDAEDFLGEPVVDAVITVPAYFSDTQRQATKDAGKIAGLNVLRIINEPTAAALAYGLHREDDIKVLVYDLGGGTFDVSIMEISDGVFEVLATAGNNQLGGDDFDKRLFDLIVEQFKSETGIDLREDKMAVQKLMEEVEKAKIDLSDKLKTRIEIPFITADESGPKHLDVEITREQFEELIKDYIDETVKLIDRALDDAGIKPEELDKVLLVGGSTRIPYVRKVVFEHLGIAPDVSVNPDEAVALGAAIQTGIISGDIKGKVLVDVVPLSLGIEVDNGLFYPIIPRNTPIPITVKKVFTTVSDNQTSVEIHILQGERAKAEDNISLGKFQLKGIEPAPRGEPRIEVKFDVDVDGILHVSAVDLKTGLTKEVTVTGRTGLSEEEIRKIIRDSRKERTKDDEFRRKATLRNKAELFLARISRRVETLKDGYDKDTIEELKEVLSLIQKQLSNGSEPDVLEELLAEGEFLYNELVNTALMT